jgi:hypothetical protein
MADLTSKQAIGFLESLTKKNEQSSLTGLDTIHWVKDKTVGSFCVLSEKDLLTITQTKFGEYRLWDDKASDTINIYETLVEAKDKAEIIKQARCLGISTI